MLGATALSIERHDTRDHVIDNGNLPHWFNLIPPLIMSVLILVLFFVEHRRIVEEKTCFTAEWSALSEVADIGLL